MKQIFILIAFGGQWEDSWETNVASFPTYEAAETMMNNLVHWTTVFNIIQRPEYLNGDNLDYDLPDDELNQQAAELQVKIDEFENIIFTSLGVPEQFRVWVRQDGYSDEMYFRIEELKHYD